MCGGQEWVLGIVEAFVVTDEVMKDSKNQDLVAGDATCALGAHTCLGPLCHCPSGNVM